MVRAHQPLTAEFFIEKTETPMHTLAHKQSLPFISKALNFVNRMACEN